MNEWGLLPEDVRALLRQKEWASAKHLRQRLLGQRRFPLQVALKVPTGAQALRRVSHFHEFIKQWRQSTYNDQILWVQKQYRQLGTHDVPSSLSLKDMQALIEFIGPKAVARSEHWEKLMVPVMEFDPGLYPILVRHLLALENMSADDTTLIARLLSQLHKNIGQGSYLRALPLKEVDTKFLENNLTLISDLLDAHFDGEISRANGLVNWLGCLDLPKAWLMVRPLCRHTRQNLCGLPILQLSAQTLRETTLPAGNILVVENNQSGYGLPALDDTIAVFGGGANVSWLDAEWLHGKNVAYWGDIDTWGFSILSDARRYLSDLKALMMDKQTFIKFRQRAIEEPSPVEQLPPNLFAEEIELFDALQQGDYRHSRLEQERLSSDYIANQLLSWVS
ncbi:MAG: DUF3322 domain-containing protein [Gammaproteobacteria bacterium]|jgi:hypothetical protein